MIYTYNLRFSSSFSTLPSRRGASMPLLVMMSIPVPEKKYSPTCAPDPCRLELSVTTWFLEWPSRVQLVICDNHLFDLLFIFLMLTFDILALF